MEEPKTTQNTPPVQDPNPPTATVAAQTTPPPPPPHQEPSQPPPTAVEHLQSKKRPLENSNDQLQNSKYYKMRLIVKDLRPHFLEVLRTPDFRNCKAANEIKDHMKLLVELYKQMTDEIVSNEKCNNAQGNEPLSSEADTKRKLEEQPQVAKPTVSSENKTVHSTSVSKEQQSGEVDTLGTYVVGGSSLGSNFITFTGSKPVYYGQTKETFRSTQATLGGE